MSLEEYEDFVYQAGYLYEADPVAKWKEMAAEQEKWVKYLDGKKELHILSKDTDFRVNVAGRKWINCCGQENFPDGEIFTWMDISHSLILPSSMVMSLRKCV